jgi:putative mRNA 3-end processing factor
MSINITQKGAILLSDVVSCDGFVHNEGYRVQSHVHEDHLRDFNTSLGYQRGVIMTMPSRDLLAVVRNEPALYYRNNVILIDGNGVKKFEDFEIEFIDSGHMLGSVQIAVTHRDGRRLGYSGDFFWPLDNIIKVEELVVDSTYASPESIRKFSHEYMEERLLELISNHIFNNPVLINSRRGTIERAMTSICKNINIPILVSKRMLREIEVFNTYGYGLLNCYAAASPQGMEIMEDGRYIRFVGTGDILPCDLSGHTSINLIGIYGSYGEPVVDHGNNSYTVAYSNHADFNGTIEYVRASNAKKVLTDPIRAGFNHAKTLADEIRRRLDIDALPCNPIQSNYWGE